MKNLKELIILVFTVLYEYLTKNKTKEKTEERQTLEDEIEDYTRLYERAVRQGNTSDVIYYNNLIQRRLRKISRLSRATKQ